jgi:biopolymer transport protein ExbB
VGGTVFPDIHTLARYYEMGGFVMLPLAVVGVMLWYALVYRLIIVRISRKAPRLLVDLARKRVFSTDSVTARAAAQAIEIAETADTKERLKSLLNERFEAFKREINQHKALVRSLVAVAPLLGLLGTVDGMIETFSALGDMALFTQSGGIAGGISRALFTTQIGLAISIPGLLIGRIVERRQHNINRELDQIRDLVCAMKVDG